MNHLTSLPETDTNTRLSEFLTEEDNMVTCDNCGNCWDGNAQCYCYGIHLDDEPSTPTEPVHTMTLRNRVKNAEEAEETKPKDNAEAEAEDEVKHPKCWSEHTHYGHCGQSCPCCRTEVGDTLGSCLVCNKKNSK